jgi:hypothetical protein
MRKEIEVLGSNPLACFFASFLMDNHLKMLPVNRIEPDPRFAISDRSIPPNS